MARYGSKDALYLIDGFNALAVKLQTLEVTVESATEQGDGIGDAWAMVTPSGKRVLEVSQSDGLWDTNEAGMHEIFGEPNLPDDAQSAPRIMCLGVAGNVIGRPFMGVEGALQSKYGVISSNGKLTRANVGVRASGALEDGLILHALGAETADGSTEASSVDNTADPGQVAIPITSSSVASPTVITCPVPHRLTTGDTVLIAGHSGSTPSIDGIQTVTVTGTTTFTIPVAVTVGGTGGTFTRGKTNNGGAAYLEVTGLTLGGYTNVLVTIRHSADNVTFADLVSFTARTAIGAQRVLVASGTGVNRYLAVAHDFVGSGSGASVTFFAGFARK